MARPAPETKKRTVPGMRLARGVRMKVELTKDWCMNMAKHEGAAGDPDCSAGAAVAPLRAVAQVVALEPEGPDGHGVNWLAGKRPKPGDLLYGGDAVARALTAKNEAESRELKAAQHLDEVLAVLRELVSLVDMKTRLESLHEMGHGTDWDDWRRRNQKAWAAARIAALGA